MMRRIILGLLATTSLVASATTASAADIYKVPPSVVQAFNWNGFYIGVHAGSGWGTKDWSQIPSDPLVAGFNRTDSSHAVSGFLGGGQIGFNYQLGWAVWGVEIQASAAELKGKGNCGIVAEFNCKTRVDGLATFAGRFGAAFDHILVYVKGGGAWAHDKFDVDFLGLSIPGNTQPASASDKRWGWMFGTGVEQAIARGGWSVKLEYNYMDFGTKSYVFHTILTPPLGLYDNFDIAQRIHLIKFGLNYRFGLGPVVANN